MQHANEHTSDAVPSLDLTGNGSSSPRHRLPIYDGAPAVMLTEKAFEEHDGPAEFYERPSSRADCLPGGSNAQRPCPWVSCEQHILMKWRACAQADEIEEERGDGAPQTAEEAAVAEGELDELILERLLSMNETCMLDVTKGGGVTLALIGRLFGVTRERIRQVERKGLQRLRDNPARREVLEQFLESLAGEPTASAPQRAHIQVQAVHALEHAPPPERHRHLPVIAQLASPEDQFWCGRIHAALTGTLCLARHTAVLKGSGPRPKPTFRDCASCPDGAALLQRTKGRKGQRGTAQSVLPTGLPARGRLRPTESILWKNADDTDLGPCQEVSASEINFYGDGSAADDGAPEEAAPDEIEETVVIDLVSSRRTAPTSPPAPRGRAAWTPTPMEGLPSGKIAQAQAREEIVKPLLQGGDVAARAQEISERTGVSLSTVWRWRRLYSTHGLAGLVGTEHQRGAPGRKRLCSDRENLLGAVLRAAIEQTPPPTLQRLYATVLEAFAAATPPGFHTVRLRWMALRQERARGADGGEPQPPRCSGLGAGPGPEEALRPPQLREAAAQIVGARPGIQTAELLLELAHRTHSVSRQTMLLVLRKMLKDQLERRGDTHTARWYPRSLQAEAAT